MAEPKSARATSDGGSLSLLTDTVARPLFVLQTVGKLFAGAEVDEVGVVSVTVLACILRRLEVSCSRSRGSLVVSARVVAILL